MRGGIGVEFRRLLMKALHPDNAHDEGNAVV
jgi:hypothetical protein